MVAVYQRGTGRCGCLSGDSLVIVPDVPGEWVAWDEANFDRCVNQWEVYKQYDYRAGLGQSMYDVARRLVYSRVSVVVSESKGREEGGVLDYLHAVNALE